MMHCYINPVRKSRIFPPALETVFSLHIFILSLVVAAVPIVKAEGLAGVCHRFLLSLCTQLSFTEKRGMETDNMQ